MPAQTGDARYLARGAGPSVLIRAAVLSHVFRYRQTSWRKREAGGQLFAGIEGEDWTVVEATGPRRGDTRSRFGYRPDRRLEQREIESKFASGLHYVGDWHTHPEPRPKPSPADFASMDEMVGASRHELPGFLMLIAGTSADPAGLWLSFHRGGGRWQRFHLAAPVLR